MPGDGSSSIATGVVIPAVTADTVDVTSLPALTTSDFVYVSDNGDKDGSVGSVFDAEWYLSGQIKGGFSRHHL